MSDLQEYRTIETKEIKHTIKLRDYVTGADEEAIKELTTSAMKTVVTGAGVAAESRTEVDTGLTTRLDRLKVSLFVVQFDNETDISKIPELVYSLRRNDFHQVLDAINSITKDVMDEAQVTKKK